MELPNSVTEIGNKAFYSCASLGEVFFSDRLKTIGESAFYDCDRLLTVEVPDSVASIGASAFSACDRLSSVSLGSGLRTIGTYAFNSCPQLTAVFFKEGLETVSANAFTNSPIAELDFPDSVITLTPSALNSGKNGDVLKSSLKRIHWPAGVKVIADSQFMDFTALEEIDRTTS